MEQQRQAYIYALATVLFWCTVPTAFKLSLRHLEPVQLLFYCTTTSLFVLALILFWQGKFSLLFSYNKRDYFYSVGLGVISPFLYYLVLFEAYDLLLAQEAQALNYTWTLTLTFLSVPLLKQQISRRDVIASLICYIGVVIIATRGEPWALKFSSITGVVLALLSTVLWSLYWIGNTKDQRDPVVSLFLSFSFALPFIALYCSIFSSFTVSSYGLWGAIYIGCFEMGITFVLWLKALKLTKNTSQIANFIFISPFLSLIVIYFVLGESIYFSTLIGLVFIIGGLVLQKWKTSNER